MREVSIWWLSGTKTLTKEPGKPRIGTASMTSFELRIHCTNEKRTAELRPAGSRMAILLLATDYSILVCYNAAWRAVTSSANIAFDVTAPLESIPRLSDAHLRRNVTVMCTTAQNTPLHGCLLIQNTRWLVWTSIRTASSHKVG